jgi:PH/SEC7 domain-containing protein
VQYSPHSKNATKSHANWTAKYKYLVAEKSRYECYVDALNNAIALRIKKQGEKKLEKSLQRSMTSFHRRESEDGAGVSNAKAGLPLGRTNGFKGRRDMGDDLIIAAGARDVDGEEEMATTPVAAVGRR